MFNPDCRYICEMEIFTRENEPLVEELAELRAEIKALQGKEKAIKDTLLDQMCNHHITSFETDSAKVLFVEDSNYKTVNSEKLKKQYPSVYYACSTYHYKDAYLIMRLKNNGSRKEL